MAKQQSNLISLFDYYKTGWNGSERNNLSLVKDLYSGKFYGDSSFEAVSRSLAAATTYYTNIVAEAESNKWGTQHLREPQWGTMGAMGGEKKPSPYEEAKQVLSNIGATKITKDNYVYSDRVTESYSNDPSSWHRYFEGSYKSPRLQEEQNNRIASNQQEANPSEPLASLAIPSDPQQVKTTSKTTGLAPTLTPSNPFAYMESGLGV
jgi:hypothetical protein